MPRLTPEHAAEVRGRIVVAAARVFASLGYHHATMQDVVRESGLSVGAIYSHFRGKDELFLASCDWTAAQGLGELADRLVPARSFAEKLAIAIGYFFDDLDAYLEAGGTTFLLQAWAEADREPAVRAMLARRREQLVGVAQLLLREGIASGAVPAWIQPDQVARAYLSLLDGLVLQHAELGAGYRRSEAEAQARALAEVLLASAATNRPTLPVVAPRPVSHAVPAEFVAEGRVA